ncbi:MAG TPA: hypothetical protein VFS02_17365 [Telluria sp.]|nr:hypothetical protein [Telluria sp.]
MDAAAENRLTIGATVVAVLIALPAVWWWPRGALPDPAPAPSARAWDGPIGPGLAGGASVQPAGSAPLVADLALRKLMDSYLGQAGERSAGVPQLRALLAQRLAVPAMAEADRIITAYLGYLEMEDQLLARERFNAMDGGLSEPVVARLLAWQGQRAQRRERALGPLLAQAWFEADDARCDVALRDWQVQHVAPDPAQEPDPVELREQRLHGAALEARRDENAQACAAQIIRGE